MTEKPFDTPREPVDHRQITALDDAINTYIACQRFYNTATCAIFQNEEYGDDQLLVQGMHVTACWLNQQAEELQQQVEIITRASTCWSIKEPLCVYRVI